MKKIMIVTGGLGPGGLERVTSHVANWFVSQGWSVFIACLLDKEPKVFVPLASEVGVEFFFEGKKACPKGLRLALKWVSYLKHLFSSKEPDIVLAMTLKVGALCCLARRKKSIRVVMREISDPKAKVRSRIIDRLLFRVCRSLDGCIFQTEWEKSCYPKRLQERGRVIPNPVAVSCVAPLQRKKEIVTMGRLFNSQKRHDVLIKAFSLFARNHPDFVLKIYGNGPDLENDRALATQEMVGDRVLFCGAVKNVHQKIKDASVFVLTSDFEGLSNALVEAMLIGIPCITSDWPGAREVISHGKNGLIYPRQDVSQLAALMDLVIENNELASRLSTNGRKEWRKYEPTRIVTEYAAVIKGEEK